MLASLALGNLCEELRELGLSLRGAVPLTWQGEAAVQFETQVEGAITDLARITSMLTTALGLARAHEHHMRILEQTLRAGA